LGATYSILNKLFDLAPPLLIGLAVDVVVRNQDSLLAHYGLRSSEQQLWGLALVTLIIWGLESIFEYLFAITWRDLAQELQHEIRIRAYDHVQSLDLASLDELTSGKLMAVLNDDVNQMERFFNDGANTILQLATTITVVGLMFVAAVPSLAWMAFLPAPLIWVASVKVQNALAPRYREVRDQAARINDLLANNLGGLAVIKSFVSEGHESKRLAAESLQYQKRNERAIRLSSAFVPIIRMAIVVGFILIMVYGGLLTIGGGLAVGTYSVLIFMTQRLLWPLTHLGTTLDLYRRSMASIHRILEVLDLQRHLNDGQVPLQEVRGDLSFESVTFAYPRGKEPVLDGFSLQVKAGTTLGIVGTTGSGKSTLVKLLLRFYDPQQGQIVLDGHPLPRLTLESLRRHIGLVSQDVFLFDGTVEENLRYGTFEASEEELAQVMRQAAVDEFLPQLPMGLQTLVGERGVRLSGGQRQRIALARAVFGSPKLVVLDEPNSNLDGEGEAALHRLLGALKARGTTVVLIAHRPSVLVSLDKVLVLTNGAVADWGPVERVMPRIAPGFPVGPRRIGERA